MSTAAWTRRGTPALDSQGNASACLYRTGSRRIRSPTREPSGSLATVYRPYAHGLGQTQAGDAIHHYRLLSCGQPTTGHCQPPPLRHAGDRYR